MGTRPSVIRFFQFNDFADAFGLDWFQQLAADAAFYRIEQLHPVFQRRIFHHLPRFRPPFTRIEDPTVANLIDIDFHALAISVSPRPADIPLGHCYVSWPLTHSISRQTYSTMSPVFKLSGSTSHVYVSISS